MEISQYTLLALILVVGVNTLFIGALAVLLFLVNRKLGEGVGKLAPLVDRGTETLRKVDDGLIRVQEKVDRILETTTGVVENVGERIDRTTAVAEKVVTEPLIGAASVVAGINRGLRVYAAGEADAEAPADEKES